MTRSRNVQPTDYERQTGQWWAEQRAIVGGRAMFVDTCAILACFVERDRIKRYLEEELLDCRLVTSSYHIAEAARRLSKPHTADPFVGPGREVAAELALHIIQKWLGEHQFTVLHVIKEVFDHAVLRFRKHRDVRGWDMVDALSVEIVLGLKQDRIVSADKGFLAAGILLAPSDACAAYRGSTWMHGV